MQTVTDALRRSVKYLRDTYQIAVYFYYAYKILLKMPMYEWKTFEELKAYGIPHKRAVFAVHIFVDHGLFEARFSMKGFRELIGQPDADVIVKAVGHISFEPQAPEFFEYRYVERPTKPELDTAWSATRAALSPA